MLSEVVPEAFEAVQVCVLGCSFTETLYALPELIRVLKVKLTLSVPVCSITVSSALLF